MDCLTLVAFSLEKIHDAVGLVSFPDDPFLAVPARRFFGRETFVVSIAFFAIF